MPVAKNSAPPIRQVAILGLGLVMTLATGFFLVSQADQLTDADNLTLGQTPDPIFRAGNVDRLAADVAKLGPLLLPDLAGGDRDIYLNHVGDDADAGWFAFAVRPASASRDCHVEWDPATASFVDNCTDTVYPPTGEGLPSLAVSIDADGDLTIDLASANGG